MSVLSAEIKHKMSVMPNLAKKGFIGGAEGRKPMQATANEGPAKQ
jgi:hypothetical protein